MNENILNNNTLAYITQKAAPHVLSAIKTASAKTGVNFAYLVEQAAAESNFNEKAQAKTSSATGLYQFIESTWMNMVKKHGHKYGLGQFAKEIDEDGKVADPQTREQILDLRKNPKKAALLAAEFAAENKAYLERHVGGYIGSTELYFAHFMGASGASGFLNAMKDNPLQTAADLFPKAARANHNVFYDRKTGDARTLAGVYDFFDKKFTASELTEGEHDTAAAPPVQTKPRGVRIRPTPVSYETLVMKPFLSVVPKTSDNTSDSLSMMAILSRQSLMANPVELMMMANLSPSGETDYRR